MLDFTVLRRRDVNYIYETELIVLYNVRESILIRTYEDLLLCRLLVVGPVLKWLPLSIIIM